MHGKRPDPRLPPCVELLHAMRATVKFGSASTPDASPHQRVGMMAVSYDQRASQPRQPVRQDLCMRREGRRGDGERGKGAEGHQVVAPGVGVASAAAEGRQGAQEEALAGDVPGHPHLRRRPSTWAASCDSYGCGPGDASNPHPHLRQRPFLGLPGVTRTAQARVMPQTPKGLALRTLNPNSRDSKSLATTGASRFTSTVLGRIVTFTRWQLSICCQSERNQSSASH